MSPMQCTTMHNFSNVVANRETTSINKMQMKNNERIFDFRVKQHTGQRSLNTVKWELREITEGLCALRYDSAFIHDHTFANALTKS